MRQCRQNRVAVAFRSAPLGGEIRCGETMAELGMPDLAILRRAGMSDRAILDATYVCVGFNIITRIAHALGFKIPAEELFVRAAKLLKIFGYRRLSGFWISVPSSKNTSLYDPYAQHEFSRTIRCSPR